MRSGRRPGTGPAIVGTSAECGADVADQIVGLIGILEANIDTITAAQDSYHRD